ncbi:MAG: hypothetical protein RL695_1821 [Pseudomonadota bacterium]|jgi:hypothetical protein
MAYVGFKKTYPAESFGVASVLDLFTHLKLFVANAGFKVLHETERGIDFIRAGSADGVADDDTPHWAFSFAEVNGAGIIYAHAVFGKHYLDADARIRRSILVSSGWLYPPIPAVSIWFAASGAGGGWWLHGTSPDADSATGIKMNFAYAGVSSRRYPSDMHQGLCARYGVWSGWGSWDPAYSRSDSGEISTSARTGTWSAFGEGRNFNGKRHPGSPLPKMAIPQFPNRDYGIGACILGEFNEILVLTDGYAQEETVVPGWVAMIGNDWNQPYAVPTPEAFTQL